MKFKMRKLSHFQQFSLKKAKTELKTVNEYKGNQRFKLNLTKHKTDIN